MSSNRIAWEILRTLDTSTMSSSSTWYPVGTPFVNPSYKCKLVNNSNVLVTVSTDGVNAMDVAPAGSFWLYDEGAEYARTDAIALPKGTQISCKAATAGVGLVYLVTQYLQG